MHLNTEAFNIIYFISILVYKGSGPIGSVSSTIEVKKRSGIWRKRYPHASLIKRAEIDGTNTGTNTGSTDSRKDYLDGTLSYFVGI